MQQQQKPTELLCTGFVKWSIKWSLGQILHYYLVSGGSCRWYYILLWTTNRGYQLNLFLFSFLFFFFSLF